jgi:hypothetical protein
VLYEISLDFNIDYLNSNNNTNNSNNLHQNAEKEMYIPLAEEINEIFHKN